MSTTDTETAERRLQRLEAELARIRQRADARDHLGPIDVPASARAMWNHARAEERRALQKQAAEREREQAERQAKVDAPKRERRDKALAALDARIAEAIAGRNDLSSEIGRLMAERSRAAGSVPVISPAPARPFGQPRDAFGRPVDLVGQPV